MGNSQSRCTDDKGKVDNGATVRKLSGNCNSQTVALTIVNKVPNPPIRASGNCNSIKIFMTEVHCPHGNDCTSKEEPDVPIKVSGNCNAYKVNVTSYGPAPKELVYLTGNMNEVTVDDPKSVQCTCQGKSSMEEQHQRREALESRPPPQDNVAVQQAVPDHPPPAYEAPPPAEAQQDRDQQTQQESPEDTKTLLMSSISSLDELESLDGRH